MLLVDSYLLTMGDQVHHLKGSIVCVLKGQPKLLHTFLHAHNVGQASVQLGVD